MHDRRFDPAQAYRLEDPERLTFMPPEEVLAALDLSPGLVVADIGAGTGYFTLPIAMTIGATGRLYAVDVEPAMLKLLDEKLGATNAPENVQLVEGDATKTSLPDGTCDLILLANVWHEIEDQAAVLAEVRRILKPKGRIAILDWRSDVPARAHGAPRTEADPPGPPREHRIAEPVVRDNLRAQGWMDVRSLHVGLYSYLVVATRS